MERQDAAIAFSAGRKMATAESQVSMAMSVYSNTDVQNSRVRERRRYLHWRDVAMIGFVC